MSKKDRRHAQAATGEQAGQGAGLDQAAGGQEPDTGAFEGGNGESGATTDALLAERGGDPAEGGAETASSDGPFGGLRVGDNTGEALSDGSGEDATHAADESAYTFAAQKADDGGSNGGTFNPDTVRLNPGEFLPMNSTGGSAGLVSDAVCAEDDGGARADDEAVSEAPATPILDVMAAYGDMITEAYHAGYELNELGLGRAVTEEIFAFYRDNPTAPDEAGLIHVCRKFKITVPVSLRTPLFPIVLSAARLLVTGLLAHDKAMKDAAQPAPVQDRAPMHGGTGFELQDEPFAATGLSPST